MSIKTKLAALALVAVTAAAGVAASTNEASAKPKFGPLLGVGLIAGTAIGLAAASSGHGYGPGCRWVPRYNPWGHYVGSVKICSW